MLNTHNYKPDNVYATYKRAKKRKVELKQEGFRVKIQKTVEGEYSVWIKDQQSIGIQQRQGNGRVGWVL